MKRNTWLKLMAVAMIACATAASAAEKVPAAVKGNPDSKVYHKAECRYYNAKSSTKAFKSEAEARGAGYTPCKRCAAPTKEKKAKSPKKPE